MQTQWYAVEWDSDKDMVAARYELVHSYNSFANGRGLSPLTAVLERKSPGTDNVILYFTPEAGQFAERVSAEPCKMPHRDDGRLALFAGDPRVLDF